MTTHEKTSADNQPAASTPSRLSLGELEFVLVFSLLILAAGVVVWLNYRDNLRDVYDGLSGFSTGGLALLGLVLAGSVFSALIPVLVREPDSTAAPDVPLLRGTARQNRALEIFHAEKQRLLRAIRDMDFDYDMGKLPDAIYAEQRVYLVRQAVAVLRRLDALEAEIEAQQDRVAAALAAFRGER